MKMTSFIAMLGPSLHNLRCACLLSIWNIQHCFASGTVTENEKNIDFYLII